MGWNKTDSLEIYNLTADIWNSAEPMPNARNALTEGEFLFTWGNLKLYQYEQRGKQWLEIENHPFDHKKKKTEEKLNLGTS